MINRENLQKLLSSFKNKNILVFGDVMLDRYINGKVTRISPEAPVPVLKEENQEVALGGAANVAQNIAALGAKVILVGVVGNDDSAKVVRRLSHENSILAKFVIDKNRPTTTKTRVVSMRHQLVRFDKEENEKVSGQTEKELVSLIKKIPNQDLVVISDYNKGCLTKLTTNALKNRFGDKNIIADIKPENAELVKNVRVISPNRKEAEELIGVRAHDNAAAGKAAQKLADKLKTSVVLTRGEHGMTTFDQKTKKAHHLPTRALSIFNETGAGDTVIAVLGLMIASGADLILAAEVANHAAGIVVSEPGTTTITKKKLIERLFGSKNAKRK